MIKTILTHASQFPQIGESQFGEVPAPKPRKTKKIIFLMLLIIILAALIGTAVCLYLRIWDPLWNPFRPTPEKVIQEMILKMKDLKSFHLEADTSVVASEKEKSSNELNLSLNTKLDFDADDKSNPKFYDIFDIGVKLGSEAFSINASLSGEIKLVDKNYYFKINSLPGLDYFLSYLKVDSEDVLNQWFKVDNSKTEEYLSEYAANRDETLSKFKDLFFKSEIYSLKQQFSDEKIGDIDVYHYKLSLDLNDSKVSDFLAKETKDRINPEKSIIEIKEEIKEFADKAGVIDFDLWIGKKDLLLYKFELEKNIEDSEKNIVVKISLNLSKINEPILVEAPNGAKDILKEMKINNVWLYLEKISDSAKSIYDAKKSYSTVKCSNKNLESLCEYIENQIGAEPVIEQSKSSFCAFVKIDDYYFCVSSTNQFKKGEVDPSQEGYCDGETFVCPSQ